jgi:hypothetical protein
MKYTMFDSNLREGVKLGDWCRVFVPKFLYLCVFFKYCRETLVFAKFWDGEIPYCLKKLQIPQDRLKNRLNFFARRFDQHAAYWQFVVWFRQLSLLVLTSTIANNILLGILSSVIMSLFLWLHMKVKPFVFAFQNLVEQYFLLSGICILVSGTIYCIVEVWSMGDIFSLIITIIVLGILFLSYIGALYYLGIFNALYNAFMELWSGESFHPHNSGVEISNDGTEDKSYTLLEEDVKEGLVQ